MRIFSDNRLSAPRPSVPGLLHTEDEVEGRDATLKLLLQPPANALNQSLDDTVIERPF